MPSKPAKIFRDPLYNYVSIDRERDGWLLEILDCPEVQRLRRIHQLGVSYVTYPGADHNRLSHSLGVVHLMQQALQHLERVKKDLEGARACLLAAALLHDVGHGPFSHVFEPCLKIDHEHWSKQAILNTDSKIYKILHRQAHYLPQTVADLIDKDNSDHPAWQKALLSSQLDMDRLDYLRRDSLFTGAGYGHFDHFRILNTFELHHEDGSDDLVWSDKSKLAIEEYVFARYYMYQNVYLHHTTRGFEKLIVAMWARARKLKAQGLSVALVPAIRDFWQTKNPAVEQYLRIEEFTVLQQIQQWTEHRDKALRFLSQSFLRRDRLVLVDPPAAENPLSPDYARWESALHKLFRQNGFSPPECYCLKDQVKAKYHQPYFPEKESDEQSARNAIRLKETADGSPTEISEILPRLKPVIKEPVDQVRYYVPASMRDKALKLKNGWK